MKKICIILLIAIVSTSFNEKKARILIIGDSISIGYFPYVQEALKEDAVVVHNKGNAQHTGTGLSKLKEWLGNEHWDIIQFNWGLWDICYRHPHSKVQGNRDKVKGTISTTPEEYRRNLDKLVSMLKATNAKLIYVTTTYVPAKEEGRFTGDEEKYNRIAKDVMNKYHVQINDLYKSSVKVHTKFGLSSDNVHYTNEGYKELSKPVTKALRKAIHGLKL